MKQQYLCDLRSTGGQTTRARLQERYRGIDVFPHTGDFEAACQHADEATDDLAVQRVVLVGGVEQQHQNVDALVEIGPPVVQSVELGHRLSEVADLSYPQDAGIAGGGALDQLTVCVHGLLKIRCGPGPPVPAVQGGCQGVETGAPIGFLSSRQRAAGVLDGRVEFL
ncbi:hypothetical protein ACIP6X_28570 [Streptomyces coeruleorubidus]|uniref:hypothetical protein n=1 Tax=Streptomyces coeruleorubidus TaxID=116188 RepID=UPI00381144F0